MKNSNKWALAAALVFLTFLTGYDMALRAEYRTGAYRNPLNNYTSLNFKNFTSVDVPAASVLKVKIMQGPFSVRLNKDGAAIVHVAQQGQRLVVTASFPGPRTYWGRETLIITCPQLRSLTTDAVYRANGRPQLDQQPQPDQLAALSGVQVQGFAQDSLVVRQNHTSRVLLAGNTLGHLQAAVGSAAGGAALHIASGNHIGAADLDIRHRGQLVLDNVAIVKLRYHFADSATATLSGTALAGLVR